MTSDKGRIHCLFVYEPGSSLGGLAWLGFSTTANEPMPSLEIVSCADSISVLLFEGIQQLPASLLFVCLAPVVFDKVLAFSQQILTDFSTNLRKIRNLISQILKTKTGRVRL